MGGIDDGERAYSPHVLKWPVKRIQATSCMYPVAKNYRQAREQCFVTPSILVDGICFVLASESDHDGPNQRDGSGRPTLTALVRRMWPTLNTGDVSGGSSTHTDQV
jgi:hypothetical protein